MKCDIESNYAIEEALAAATVTGTTAVATGINGALYGSGAFLLAATAVGTTLDAKMQFSADNSTFVDAEDVRNTLTMTQLDDAGTGTFYVAVWEAQYARILATAVGACVFGITSVAGPAYSVAAE